MSGGLETSMARLEAKFDAQKELLDRLLGAQDARLSAVERSQARQGERIGALEAAEQQRKGATAVLATAAGFAGALIAKFLPGWGQ